MSDKELAKAITDHIFSMRGGRGDPVNRIQFMAGTWPGDERPRGGLNREAFQREVEIAITAYRAESAKGGL